MAYELVEIGELSDIPKGSQIAVKGSFKDLNPTLAYFYPLFSSEEYYYHHGVYLGNCKVAHLSGRTKADAKPRRCDILQFLRGGVDGKLYRVEYDDTVEKLPVEETLKKAEAVLAEPLKWPGFQIIKNNCESFASWLKTGIKWSAQATKAVIKVLPLAAAGTAGAIFSCSYGGPIGAGVGVAAGGAVYAALKIKKEKDM